MTGKQIVIIGGGATGTTAVIALAQIFAVTPPAENISLHLFDPDGFGHGGLAYGKSGHALLNETADGLSPWNPPAFAQWCGSHGKSGDPKAFHERATFGAFHAVEYRAACANLRAHNVTLHEHREAVTAIAAAGPGSFTITAAQTTLPSVAAANILLAPGYGPSTQFAALDGRPGYIASLYPPEIWLHDPALQKAEPRLLVLGCGPAVYDVLWLLPENFAGSIIAASPSGRCPGRRDVAAEGGETRWSLTTEFRAAATATELRGLIETALAEAESNGSTVRRTALDIQRELPSLLRALPGPERAAFAKGGMSRLFHAATPVPPESWARRLALEAAGRFTVRQARLSAANIRSQAGGGFTVAFAEGAENFDAILNCAGHDPLNQTLVRQLLASGLARQDDGLKLLATEDDGYHLRGSTLACIGPPTHIGLHGVEAFYAPVQRWAASVVQP